jgi:uncharacterized Ntn-hydrolase superfamily protein
MRIFTCCLLFLSSLMWVQAQDTYSIVAVDSVTGAVGSAGASCVDLTNFSLDADFLGELFPGQGAINTQAWYLPANQANARTRMQAGDTPQEIIDWLVANDVQNNPALRQYGIAALVDGSPQAAAHTGVNTDDWKGHRVGDHYSIQGNILLGEFIVDAMETNFLNTEGLLAEKLMAAMQGANVVGADTRCTANGTSSLFAFLKVAQPDDEFGSPSLVLGVITEDGDGIEPVDSLQSLFNNWFMTVSNEDRGTTQKLAVFPNPTTYQIQLEIPFAGQSDVRIFSIDGQLFQTMRLVAGSHTLSLSDNPNGVYVVQVMSEDGKVMLARVVKE